MARIMSDEQIRKAEATRIRRELLADIEETADLISDDNRDFVFLRDVIAAIDRICQDGPLSACAWTEDDNGCWETDCGGAFGIDEGTPSENGMRFCCYCGRPLEGQAWTESDEDEEIENVHD